MSKFENVTIVRVPIKEEVIFKKTYNYELKNLSCNFNEMWNFFVQNIEDNNKTISLSDKFEIDDYLASDTHWSVKGNKVFSDILKDRNFIKNF